jgi:HEAT repeat protein
LIDALVRESFSASRIATQLDQFPIPIAHLVRPLLASPRPHARYWAASLLRRYPDTPGLSSELAALTADAHAPARKAAMESLAAMNESTAMVVAKRLVRDPVAYVRARAVRAFAAAPSAKLNFMMRAARARNIAPMLADSEWQVRQAAKEALVTLGAAIWREVAPYLDSPDRFARNGAAEVLQNLGLIDQLVQSDAPGVGALDVLERSFREGGPGVVAAAIARAHEPPVPEVASLLERFGYVAVRPA